MKFGTLTPILRCSECGARHMELRGPVTDDTVVRCAECGGGAGPWAEFLADLDARIKRQNQERRGRRLRYRARKHADPAPSWHLILSIPLDEFSLSFADLSGGPSSVEGSRLLRHAVEVSRVESRGGVSSSCPRLRQDNGVKREDAA